MRVTIALALLALSCAQAQEPAQYRDAVLSQLAQQLGDEIGLDDERMVAFETIYVEHVENRIAVFRKHGISAGAEERPGIRTLMALRRDLRAVDEATIERLSTLLTEEELDAYRAGVELQRERNRELIR